MDHYISREKTIEAIKTDLSQFVYDEYGNMTALGVRLIHRIGNMTGVEPFGNLIDRDELLKDIKCQTERDGRTSSDVITKGVLEVFLDYIRNFPSARPVNETVEHDKGDLISREATIADLHTADIPDEWMAWIEHFVNVQPSVTPERKKGKWIVEEDCEGKTRNCICDQCGYETGDYTWETPNYCENCGAKMGVDT